MAICISRDNVLPGPCRYALQRQGLSGITNAVVWNPDDNPYSAEFCFDFH